MSGIKFEQGDNQFFLVLNGVVGAAESPRIRGLLSKGFGLGKQVVIDFSHVVRIDTAIAANLVEAAAVARDSGVELALKRVPDTVLALFELLRLDQVLVIEDQSL